MERVSPGGWGTQDARQEREREGEEEVNEEALNKELGEDSAAGGIMIG
jgi:hypothetical protein